MMQKYPYKMHNFTEQEQSNIINQYTSELAKIIQEKKIMTNIDLVKLNRINQTNLSTAFLHMQTFPRFKGIHMGKDIVLVASGVTASRYTGSKIKDAIHIGVNRSFQLNNYEIPMDYIFIQDYSGKTKEYIDGIVILLNKEVHNAFYDYSCYPERYIKILINCCKSYLNELVIMHYIYDSGYVNLFDDDKYYQSFLSSLSRSTLSTFIKDDKVIDEILNISDGEMVKISEKYLSKLINS